MAAAWARARREAPRRFDANARAFLCEYPWPGNLRELEAVVEQTLASTARDPLGIDDLVLEGSALAPLDASAVGTLLPDGEEEEAAEPEHSAQPSAASEAVPPAPSSAPAFEPPLHRGEPPRIRDDDPGLRRLANALIHQVRNPLATIRTFAELLPERFDDPDFRARFPEMVREDVGRIHGLLARLEQLASLDAPRRDKVDVSQLISDLLEKRREAFRERHHLVLKELDSSRPTAIADAAQLRLAFEALFDKALAIVPERGDLYIASRRHEGGGASGPTVRVLLRFHDPSAGGTERARAAPELDRAVDRRADRARAGRTPHARRERSRRARARGGSARRPDHRRPLRRSGSASRAAGSGPRSLRRVRVAARLRHRHRA